MNHVVIGVSGRRGAGKDTAARYIQDWLTERGVSAGRRGFADSLKHSFARMFIPDISVDEAVMWCDELKEGSLLTVEWTRGIAYRETVTAVRHEITGRQALQRYGTEGHRDVFGEDFWVDALLPTSKIINEYDLPEGPAYPYNFMSPMAQEAPRVCVVSDTRFDNEAKRVKLLKGFNLVILRDGGAEDQHLSEAGIHSSLVDWSIRNNGSIEDLREEVRHFCDVVLASTLDVEPEKEWPQPKLPEN
jgi:hypothetical protein